MPYKVKQGREKCIKHPRRYEVSLSIYLRTFYLFRVHWSGNTTRGALDRVLSKILLFSLAALLVELFYAGSSR